MLCLTPSLSPLCPHDTFQGYVTVSEINELYSQLGGDPKPAPTLANISPESEANPFRGEDTPKPPEDEVCVAVLRACVCT